MMMTTTQKRKAVDQVNHDFSDFSLSSPATKIRRLDYAELAPIMEEDELLEDEIQMPTPPIIQQEETTLAGVENEERAIVLFNPSSNTIIQHSPSTFSLSPHFLSRFKGNRDLWSKHHNLLNNSSPQLGQHTTLEEEEHDDDTSNQCLAVVPWVHSHLSPPPKAVPPIVEQIDASMMMEDEHQNEQEIASMDIEQQEEECNNNGYAASGIGFGGPSVVGFHQWQQQHCMVPSQLPHNAAAAPTPTPVVWFG